MPGACGPIDLHGAQPMMRAMIDAISPPPAKLRIPYPDPETLSPEKRQIYDTFSPMLNIMKILMVAPDPFWRGQRALGRSAVVDTSISDQHRELLVLRVAYLSNSDYELYHHLPLGKTAGLSDAKCEAMRTGDFTVLDDQERALAQFVTELVVDISPTDETLAAVRAYFPDPQLFEIIMIVGYYMLIARVIAVSGIEMDEAAVQNWTKP
jgi:4-carboxymuconolactone decarboxylase